MLCVLFYEKTISISARQMKRIAESVSTIILVVRFELLIMRILALAQIHSLICYVP
jgi:hypothetical protein